MAHRIGSALRSRAARALAVAVGAPCLALATPSFAIMVDSADDLLPADFWIYVEGSDGGFARVEERDATPVAIEITDPVVDGVTLTGHLILRAERLPTGPATTVNASLATGDGSAIDTDVDLAAFITFDLAVLSATASSAAVRIVGRGLGGAYGYEGDGFVGSTSSSSGYVTLYETNASGGTGSIVESWFVPGNFSMTPIDDEVVLATNQLYRIVVRSLAGIDIQTPATLSQLAYLIIDPYVALSSPSEELELVVSANLPEALPEPSGALLGGAMLLALAALARRRA